MSFLLFFNKFSNFVTKFSYIQRSLKKQEIERKYISFRILLTLKFSIFSRHYFLKLKLKRSIFSNEFNWTKYSLALNCKQIWSFLKFGNMNYLRNRSWLKGWNNTNLTNNEIFIAELNYRIHPLPLWSSSDRNPFVVYLGTETIRGFVLQLQERNEEEKNWIKPLIELYFHRKFTSHNGFKKP